MYIKKIIAMILCCMFFTGIISQGFAAEETKVTVQKNVAEAILEEGVIKSGFESVKSGNDGHPYINILGSKKCWYLDKSQGQNKSYINCVLGSDFKIGSGDGSEYKFEIEYFDGSKGYFQLLYDAMDNSKKLAETFYTTGSNQWRIAAVTVQDANFQSKLDERYDFRISIRARNSQKNPVSPSSVGIRRIKVTRIEAKNPVYFTYSIDETGNAYKWFSEDKIIHNRFENLTDKYIKAEITQRLISREYVCPYENTFILEFAPKEVKNIDMNFGDVKLCDIYWYETEIKSEDGTINSVFRPCEIAVVKTDPDGIKNKSLYYGSHLDWYDSKQAELGAEVMALSNVGGTRLEFRWQSVEPIKGKYRSSDDDFGAMRALKALQRNDLEICATLTGMPNFYYAGGGGVPVTDEQVNAWREYVKRSAVMLKDVCSRYEIWNEPNAFHGFNKNLVDGAGYAKIAGIAYDEIKKIDPTASVGVMSVTDITKEESYMAGWEGINFSGRAYFREAMAADIWKKADAISLHPYINIAPEDARIDRHMQWFKDEMEAKAQKEIEVWNSEFGYTLPDPGITTERMKGALCVRSALMYKAYDLGDSSCIYVFEQKGDIDFDREDRFGHVSGGLANLDKYGTYFVPTYSFLMVAGHNYVMADSEQTGIVELNNDNIRAYTFHSNKFDTEILALNTTDPEKQSETIALKLGAEEVTVYDSVGNEKKVCGKNGIYTFTVTPEPMYIVGDIKNVTSEKNFIEYTDTEIKYAEGDNVIILVENKTQENYEITVETPKCISNPEIIPFDENGKGSINFRNNAAQDTDFYITVNIEKDGQIVQSSVIKITSIKPVETNFDCKLLSAEDVNHWNAEVTIKNSYNNKAAKGFMEFSSPSFLKDIGKIDIGVTPSERTSVIKIDLPKILKKQPHYVEGKIVLDNNLVIPISDAIDFTIAPYTEEKPVIDGKLDEGEWNYDAAMYVDTREQIKLIEDWGGVSDLSGRSGIMWDEESMYAFFEVTDNVYYQDQPLPTSWQGDSIQVAFFYGDEGLVILGDAGTDFHEFCLAITPEGKPGAYRFISQNGSQPVGVLEDCEIAITRDEKTKKTVYEFTAPWDKVLSPGDEINAGDVLKFAFIVNDNDGSGRRGWIEYASGIGETKNSALFTNLMLVK